MATPIQTRLTIDLGFDQAVTFAQSLWRHAQKLREEEADYLTRPISELPGFAPFSLGHRVNRWHSFTISSEEQIEELQKFFGAEGWTEAAPARLQPLAKLVLGFAEELSASEPTEPRGHRRVSIASQEPVFS